MSFERAPKRIQKFGEQYNRRIRRSVKQEAKKLIGFETQEMGEDQNQISELTIEYQKQISKLNREIAIEEAKSHLNKIKRTAIQSRIKSWLRFVFTDILGTGATIVGILGLINPTIYIGIPPLQLIGIGIGLITGTPLIEIIKTHLNQIPNNVY